MTRFALLATLVAFATPTFAADEVSKEQDCAYQADVVAAIKTARLDRVKESKLAEAIAATEPTWPRPVQQRDYDFGRPNLSAQTPRFESH